MIKTFTEDDIIKFLYNETSNRESLEIEEALLCDTELQKQFKELVTIKNELSNLSCNPSDKSVSNILDYSKSLNLHSS